LKTGTNIDGFTLVELAVALLIVGLLLASAMIPLSAQIDIKASSDTQRVMDQIRESLIGFAQANGRLPCPADGTLASSNINAGQESAAKCTLGKGVVPWAMLGVPETDAWGRRFTYRVAPVFTDTVGTTFHTTALNDTDLSMTSAAQSAACSSPTPTPTVSSFALCTAGNLSVYTRTDATHAASPMALTVAAVILSHGKNGYGGYTQQGIAIGITAGSDEYTNSRGGTTAIATIPQTFVFISRFPTSRPQDGTCADSAATDDYCEFDDLVAWIPTSLLAFRMVNAGKLP
jgi:prepilin-type N-terminal cleavage/methylation domain-containing protein